MRHLKAGVLAAVLAGTAATAQETILFNNFLPPQDKLYLGVIKPWMEDIERVTEGRVDIVEPASTLAPPPELLNMVQSGVADGAFIMLGFLRESNHLMQLPLLPNTNHGAEVSSVALWRTWEKFFAGKEELKDVELLALITVAPGNLYNMKPKAFQSLADLRNVKMWALPGLAADSLGALGTVVTPGPAVRMYEVVSGGVVDAFCCINLESAEVFNVTQWLKAVTEVPGAMFSPSFAFFVHKEAWARLSPADQEAIRSVSGEAMARRSATGDAYEAEARARYIAAGGIVEQASDAFVAEMQGALDPVRKAWVEKANAMGVDGQAALDFYIAEQKRLLAEK